MYQVCKIYFFFVLVIHAILGISDAIAASTKPSSVILYPKGGWVQVSEKIVIQDNKIYFELPAGVQIETLQINIDGKYLGNIETKPIFAVESPIVSNLREQRMKAAQEVAGIQGKLAAVKAKIALWSKPEWVNSSVEEIKRLDTLIGPKLEELYVAEAAITPELKQAEFRLSIIENALKEVGGESPYAVGITAFVQSKSDIKNESVDVQYGYMFQHCGWKPIYQINGLPEKDIVQIMQSAEIYQASGQDWSDVELTLASVDVGGVLAPPHLFSWVIRPKPEMSQYRNMEIGPTADFAVMSAPLVIKDDPSFTTWKLGKVSLVAGISTQVSLYKGDWSAEFFRLLRPALQDQAYLVAIVGSSESVDLLPGISQFMVDGKVVGSGQFNLANGEQSIFFGMDPQVSAQMFLDKSQSGRGGFIDRKQSYLWSWNITVMNEHSFPVKVLVEDPAPQSGDSTITITTESVPQATVKNHDYVWSLTIPEKNKQLIRHKVIMTAPNDMQVIEGR